MVMRSFASVCLSVCLQCVCVSVSRALTFESLDPETSSLVCSYILRISRSSSYNKVIGSRSWSQEQNVIPAELTTYTHSRVVRFRFKGNFVKKIATLTQQNILVRQYRGISFHGSKSAEKSKGDPSYPYTLSFPLPSP